MMELVKENLLSRKQLAHQLGVCETTVHNLIKQGAIPSYKFGMETDKRKFRRYLFSEVLEALKVPKKETHSK